MGFSSWNDEPEKVLCFGTGLLDAFYVVSTDALSAQTNANFPQLRLCFVSFSSLSGRDGHAIRWSVIHQQIRGVGHRAHCSLSQYCCPIRRRMPPKPDASRSTVLEHQVRYVVCSETFSSLTKRDRGKAKQSRWTLQVSQVELFGDVLPHRSRHCQHFLLVEEEFYEQVERRNRPP